jgi:GNAT superfamily N-acetyltransferase
MVYNKNLALMIRDVLGKKPGLIEKQMFGGIGFMIHGNMACGVINDDLIVRVGPDQYNEALAKPHTRVFDMTGRPMRGWIVVTGKGYQTKRISRREFEEQLGDGNRKAMKTIVESGQIPGLLFYLNGKPVAWCSIAPRDSYASLNRSRILKKLDDTPVWSLVCFFVDKEYRNQGFIQEVLRGAITYVRDQGGTVIEAYPTVPKSEKLPPVSSYMGIPAMFEKAGFVEVARPSKSKVVMRYFIE